MAVKETRSKSNQKINNLKKIYKLKFEKFTVIAFLNRKEISTEINELDNFEKLILNENFFVNKKYLKCLKDICKILVISYENYIGYENLQFYNNIFFHVNIKYFLLKKN